MLGICYTIIKFYAMKCNTKKEAAKLSAKRAVCLSLALGMVFAASLALFYFNSNIGGVYCSKRNVSESAVMTGRDDADRPYEKYLEILPDRPLDINSATVEQLKKLPGVGDALSKRIVLHRQFAGPFLNSEDIMQVDGISETLYAGFEHLICVGDANENFGS